MTKISTQTQTKPQAKIKPLFKTQKETQTKSKPAAICSPLPAGEGLGVRASNYEETKLKSVTHLVPTRRVGMQTGCAASAFTDASSEETKKRNGITRPLIPYFGGKYRIAPKIITHFPPHEIYVEPFGGAASVLLSKPPAKTEIYNDLNEDLVNLFQVIRENPCELLRGLRRTLASETEFFNSYKPTDKKIERARRLIVRASFAFHSGAIFGEKKCFRLFASHKGSTARTFNAYLRVLPQIIKRLREVTISCRPALKLIKDMETPETLIYADPPYVSKTRKSGTRYAFEMMDNEHKALLETLLASKSMVVLSGYANPLYDEKLKKWRRVVIPTRAFSTAKQCEVEEILWINPLAQKTLNKARQ